VASYLRGLKNERFRNSNLGYASALCSPSSSCLVYEFSEVSQVACAPAQVYAARYKGKAKPTRRARCLPSQGNAANIIAISELDRKGFSWIQPHREFIVACYCGEYVGGERHTH
jgi:hypothetical protein